jgi:ubiquinone/menaquinone biosynthesis C-methylase UbiE
MPNKNTTYEVSLQEGYMRWSAQYDQEENALIAVEEQLAIPLLATIPATSILDLGTGTGRYAIRLATKGANVVALDQSEAMLSVAQQAAERAGVRIQFLRHDLKMDIPLEFNGFDLVIAALVLCHLESLDHMAEEAYRVLRPGGHLLVTDFHPAAIAAGWRTQFTNSDGTYFLPTTQRTSNHYLTALRDAGFDIQTVREALVGDAPDGAFPVDVVTRDREIPFCLSILASKPTMGEESQSVPVIS